MRHPHNSFASETPATDGKHVYAYFANSGPFCRDVDGHKLWEKRWPSHPMRDGWNTGTSPGQQEGDRVEDSLFNAVAASASRTLWQKARTV